MLQSYTFYNVRVHFLVFWLFVSCIPMVKMMVCFYRVGDGLPDGPDTQSWQHHCRDLADITHTLPQELHLLRRRILDARFVSLAFVAGWTPAS